MGLDICALVAESQWPATVVLAAAAGAVMLTMVTGPGGRKGGGLRIPLLACVPVVVLRTRRACCPGFSFRHSEPIQIRWRRMIPAAKFRV
jgi:hypothetical protein